LGSNLGSLLEAQEGKLSLAEPFLRRALEEGRREERALERDHPGGGCVISLGGNVGSCCKIRESSASPSPSFAALSRDMSGLWNAITPTTRSATCARCFKGELFVCKAKRALVIK
jgi:hypothetical protein